MTGMKLHLHLILILLLLSVRARCQEIPVIQTDRPDQTECPFIVPPGYIQGEAGVAYEDVDGSEVNYLYPTVLWRYGLNSHVELRMITELAGNKIPGKSISGLNPIRVGFKALLCEEKGIIPQTAFIGHLILPTVASKDFKSKYYATTFRFLMAHTLSKRVSIGYNLGAEWDGLTPDPSFIYTFTGGFSLTDRIGCYGEFYGFFPQFDKPDHRADAGLNFFFGKNIMLDISGGIGITPNSPDYYGSLGFSFRLPG